MHLTAVFYNTAMQAKRQYATKHYALGREQPGLGGWIMVANAKPLARRFALCLVLASSCVIASFALSSSASLDNPLDNSETAPLSLIWGQSGGGGN
jgi:hypothetical protein